VPFTFSALPIDASSNTFSLGGIDGQSIRDFNVITSQGFTSVSNLAFNASMANTSAVPEPTTWAMMLVGFGAVGYSMRRRKVGYSGMRTRAA
jgi:hypothetical protein